MSTFSPIITWLLYFVVVAYQLVDYWQTKLLFNLGAYEANPIMAMIVKATGSVDSILVVKLFLCFMLGSFMILSSMPEDSPNYKARMREILGRDNARMFHEITKG